MRWLPMVLGLLVVLMALPAFGQVPAEPITPMRYSGGITPGEVTATPEMWFYQQQMEQRNDPKVMIRRRAELRTTQREARLATQRWYGVSNSRPTTSSAVWNGEYSTRWVGGNPFYPYRWNGNGGIVVVGRSTISNNTY